MRKGLIATGAVVLVGGVAAVLYSKSISGKDDGFKTVAVIRGPVVEKALAVGAIRPKHEITVKSKISGIVCRSFREVGDRVQAGEPLFEILPDPTPMELTEARREVEIAQEQLRAGQEEGRPGHLPEGPGNHGHPGGRPRGPRHPGRPDPPEPRQREAGPDREGPGEERAPPGRGVHHPRPHRGHRPGAARQRGRSGGAAHLLPGGHAPRHPRRHAPARLQGHGRRDRRGQAPRGHARADQDRRPARGQGRGQALQDRAQVQDPGGRDPLRRGDRAPARRRDHAARRLLGQRRHRGAREARRAGAAGAPRHLQGRQGHGGSARRGRCAVPWPGKSRPASPTGSPSRSPRAFKRRTWWSSARRRRSSRRRGTYLFPSCARSSRTCATRSCAPPSPCSASPGARCPWRCWWRSARGSRSTS